MSLGLELVDALKRLLKVQGLTYAALASRLSVSEATVKRMFARHAISLPRLEAICRVLDIGLAELAAEAHSRRPPLAELTLEQEQALADNPALLLALYLVLNRWQQDEVLTRYTFTLPEWTLLLSTLDRLGIIELLPGNRTRARTARNFRWRREGPMQHFFQQRLLPEYFARPFDGDADRLLLLSGMASPAAAEHMQRRLNELAEEFDLLMQNDAGLSRNERVGISLVLAQRPWSLSLFQQFRR